ncbi:hypothetical protein LSAT2_014912 [Lamellibrachia satsuma]|nr:hypothetical protein LSAT2_014912 [Lamellibrachia satsuma]
MTCQLKVRQRRVLDALESKQIPYQVIDIANNRMAKRRMRHMSMDANAVPPRIFRGEIYLGKLTTTRDVSTRHGPMIRHTERVSGSNLSGPRLITPLGRHRTA